MVKQLSGPLYQAQVSVLLYKAEEIKTYIKFGIIC